MKYRVLPSQLESTANLVIDKFLKDELGLSGIRIEEQLDRAIDFRPTLTAKRKDHHYICVEVSETAMPLTIPSFVLQCQQQHLPVLLYIAYPTGAAGGDLEAQLRRARESGIGILAVNHENSSISVLSSPLSLSLTGLRRIDKKAIPQKYREQIGDAETAFRNGDPNKACSKVYDEIEDLTRRIARKTYSKAYWSQSLKAPATLATMPWQSMLECLKKHLDRKLAKASGHDLDSLTDSLINQVIALVPYRNDSAHKPRSLKALRERDAKLRTRMEGAIDILLDVISATKCLRM